jgi:hypothetical protein
MSLHTVGKTVILLFSGCRIKTKADDNLFQGFHHTHSILRHHNTSTCIDSLKISNTYINNTNIKIIEEDANYHITQTMAAVMC